MAFITEEKKNEPVSRDIDIKEILRDFLSNIGYFTADERAIMIKIIASIVFPKHIITKNAPIEEDWINKK